MGGSQEEVIIEGEFLEAEDESCNTDVSYPILDTKSYSMSSSEERTDNTTATIVFQLVDVEGETKVNFVCNFTSSSSSLLSDSGCLPEIYLVSGRTSCSSLPQTVTAKKLAEIHQTGAGQTLVDVSWSELTDTCVIIVKKTDCDSSDVIESRRTRQEPGCSVIKSSGVTRTFSSLSLSTFLVLLSGSSVVLKVLSSVSTSSGALLPPIYNGLTVTSYDKWSTLPFLQLPGLNSSHAILLVLTMMASYIIGAYLVVQYPNNSRIKKRIQPGKGKPSKSAAQFVNNSNLGDLIFDFVDEGLYQQEKIFNHLMGIYFRRTNKM